AAPPLPMVETVSSPGKLNEPAFIRGHDKGQSTLYDNGAGTKFSYWSFGDTVVDAPAPLPDYGLGNTAARITDLDLSDNVAASSWTYDNLDANGLPHEAFPLPPGYPPGTGTGQYRVWGGSTVADPANHRMIGIYHLVTGISTDAGYGIAIWSESTGTWQPMPIGGTSPSSYVIWPPGAGSPTFNTGMLIEGGFLYTYGCYFNGLTCALARVPVTNPAAVYDRTQWRFHTAGGGTGCPAGTWQVSVSCALPLPSEDLNFFGVPAGQMGGGGGGMSVFWNDYLGTYMQIYSQPGGNNMLYRVAYRLEGPWSAAGLLGYGIEPFSGVDYPGYAHPELAEQNGKVQYLTYARATAAGASELDLMRVQFGAIPSTYQRKATVNTTFGDSTDVAGGTHRIASGGPTVLDTTGFQAASNTTLAKDRHGEIYQTGAVPTGGAAVVRLDEQSSAHAKAVAGLTLRNNVGLAHGGGAFNDTGQGYATLGISGGNKLSLRLDSDGDQDLDLQVPASPITVSGPVWLKLARTSDKGYTGSYSTTSSTGPWTTVGSGTVGATGTQANVRQDVGIFAAGADATSVNRGVFTGFQVLPGRISTWGTAVFPTSNGSAYATGFDDDTIRNVVHTSAAGTGNAVRVRFSNATSTDPNLQGQQPLQIGGAGVGLPPVGGTGADLIAGTVTPLTFNGGSSTVTIPVGQSLYSDPVTINVPAGDSLQNRDVTVSVHAAAPTGRPTWHRVALRDSWVVDGNHALDVSGAAFTSVSNPKPKVPSWYFVSAVDVVADNAHGTVVAFGDSDTDGNPFLTSYGNWPNRLITRLVGQPPPLRLGVVNPSTAGTTLASAPTRFPAEAVSLTAPRTVLVSLGLNDLITASPPSAAQIVGWLRDLRQQARSNGARLVVATITPLGNNATTFPGSEAIRQQVNTYLRASTELDAVVDFDAVVRDPANPAQIRSDLAAGAGSIHLSPAGNQALADALDLAGLDQPPRTR
ncbi:MAG TPA: GDSL-type esterase/lipase family protein, partial [Acidimicrobiales bacterium]|nr:GDSL-type esterase/lipase family protein [Acidimicrobiales bacterium]